MFTRTPARLIRSSAASSVRFQSSSSSTLKIKKQVILQDQQKQLKSTKTSKASSKDVAKTRSNESAKGLSERPKKGFSSLPKVPSTLRLSPKNLLLDNLFSGYRPLTSPIKPLSKLNKSPKTYLYLELDSADYLDEQVQKEPEERNHSRYQYSNYSFAKPEIIKSPVTASSTSGQKGSKRFTEREGKRGRKRLATPANDKKRS
ncbi:unnamed protein product [Kuraishia capsulata CBS 1993]|uniref:Uncharacterized protein n=1 Tax=Kuraishia capsulata CBS 1993 TaxID=1382522 RepID=W6MPU2_9ASCO|nr:uncharacterized protein KUCA_T00004650001 [Kuraishia capsulata CBS 1993]CDK28666.1 unnamed protein product [Kuraishia capsulata CBS 1993]